VTIKAAINIAHNQVRVVFGRCRFLREEIQKDRSNLEICSIEVPKSAFVYAQIPFKETRQTETIEFFPKIHLHHWPLSPCWLSEYQLENFMSS